MLLYRDDENVAKVKELESAAVNMAPDDITAVCAGLGEVKLSARALGLACRFRGVDCVKALVECGATFDTPKKREEKMLYHAYSPMKYDFHHSNYSIYLLNIDKKLEGSYCAKSMRFPTSVKTGKMRLFMLPDSERGEVLKYLCETKEKCAFKPSELLFYSIFARDDFITGELKKNGIGLSENRIKALVEGGEDVDCYWREYRAMTDALAFEDFIAITERLFGELGGKKIRCTENFFVMIKSELFDPKFAEFFFDKFNTGILNRSKLLREMIDHNKAEFLPIAEKAGWLADIKRRDQLIEYSNENGKTECTAWLLDFKNRTADLAAEREKAERKLEREMNAAPDSVTALKALWNYKKLEDGTLMIKRYKGEQTEITVPEKIGRSTVTVIGDMTFSCEKTNSERGLFLQTIKKITLPQTITQIGNRAFFNCRKLEEINIPAGVTKIGEMAFAFCESLGSIKLPENLDAVSNGMLENCTSLREITVPDTVRRIGYAAFANCGNLVKIVMPDRVERVFGQVFMRCAAIEHIKLPDGLDEITYCMFFHCEKLKEITIPDSVKVIRGSAFESCFELSEVVIPNSVTAISETAFSNCPDLKTVVIPASVKQILNGRDGKQTIFHNSGNVTAVVELNSCAENYCKLNDIPYRYKD